MKCFYLALALMAVSAANAATFNENFATDPMQNGWQVFGNTNLFTWDSINQDLDVTWDSSQGNSYFYHPLGTILTTNDDFTLAFDLQINAAEASGYGFELAVGLFNLGEATNADFQRSTDANSPNLVEFDYFPDTGYSQATFWPIFADTNSTFNWNGPSDFAIYEPNLGDWYHVEMTYTASNLTMVTTMTNFEQTAGVIIDDPINLMTNEFAPVIPFSDCRVDTISISSYQDDGFGDSIYAQGAVANIAVTLPPPPVQNLTGAPGNGVWQTQFSSQDYWLYTLQRTGDFQCWTNISPATPGNGGSLLLQDADLPADQAFYRVSASRP